VPMPVEPPTPPLLAALPAPDDVPDPAPLLAVPDPLLEPALPPFEVPSSITTRSVLITS